MTRLRALWESVRATYWALPSVMAVSAAVLAVGVIELDERFTARLMDQWSWIYTGGPEGARAVLSTIAASMITVAGVAFSITIVALTLASQQFGPRLLRSFLRDVGNQIVLGTFIATYVYCLLVLRTVRGEPGTLFVPHVAVTLGVVLAMFSLGVLIFFIHHVSTSIQATQVIARVSVDLDSAISRLFPERIGAPAELDAHLDRRARLPDGAGYVVSSGTTGYVQAVDGERLMAAARELDVVIRVDARPGAFVSPEYPLASLWASDLTGSDAVDGRVRAAFIIGPDRTGTQDVGFFIHQLVELAVRALSPGINDPATARACIDRLERALAQLMRRSTPTADRVDADGTLRVIANPVTAADLVHLAFDEIGHHARGLPSVTCRLLDAVAVIAARATREEDRAALERLARTIGERNQDAALEPVDRARVAERWRATMAEFERELAS